ncbi:type II toxin-antitoxin system RelE/ParE family toxin [Sphingomonas morindae]|uniref:Type II toxin-antitoxin system RelE/ParE family toxin n=1 Tax=Sphingomonas morindae TaxID=1541170 RepID=A0ABY4X4U3_9SPHN|nr:type II toxin-antitoxin system RelE/ParE family toxin [Sphingomonas morindae]USI71891.1 type II toxin-antitoxin system RelE/ParE family toxin [Sphingomonas morindae]
MRLSRSAEADLRALAGLIAARQGAAPLARFGAALLARLAALDAGEQAGTPLRLADGAALRAVPLGAQILYVRQDAADGPELVRILHRRMAAPDALG